MPVRIFEDWQIPMTRCAVETLRCTTKKTFELVIVEADGRHCREFADRHVPIGQPTGNVTAEINEGIAAATAALTVYTGNDVFVRPGWLEALLACFDIEDCAVATLASADLRHSFKDAPWGQDRIIEGVYGPFMAFSTYRRFDAETFPCQFADTDMIMGVYEEGLRSYRNWSVVIEHLNRQTLSGADNNDDYTASRQRFMQKHSGPGGHLMMFQYLAGGQVI